MSQINSSEGPEALNDPVSRLYICFCEKRFTTYPGVYLHLKSKHVQVFEKYKKLKITKLFKRIEDQQGYEVYRLDKLSQIDKISNNFSQKKNKELKKKTPPPAFPIQQPPSHSHLPPLPREQGELPKRLRETSLPPLQFQFRPDLGGDLLNPGNGMSLPPLGGGFPLYMPPGNLPPYLQFPPPLMSHSKPSIKRTLQRFLLEFGSDKVLLRKVMYNLMVYIDDNFGSLEDPRAKDKGFLSYCDWFDPTFIRPLLEQRIDTIKREKNQTRCDATKPPMSFQIDALQHYQFWLTSTGLIGSQQQRGAFEGAGLREERVREVSPREVEVYGVSSGEN